MELVSAGASLKPLWIGKIATGHGEAIVELMQRGLVQQPLFEPEFLEREAIRHRIGSFSGETSFNEILGVE